MTDLVIDPVNVHEVRFSENSRPAPQPVAEDVDAGEVVTYDPTSGKLVLASADGGAGSIRAIALKSNVEGATITTTRGSYVDLGADVLEAADFGDPIYLSDTPGKLSLDIADSTEEIVMGYVVPAWGGGAWAEVADKIMWVTWEVTRIETIVEVPGGGD